MLAYHYLSKALKLITGLNGQCPLKDLRLSLGIRSYPGPDQLSLTQPIYASGPDLRLNEFLYPTGIRPAEFHGLISQKQYDALMPLAFPNDVPTHLPLVLEQNGLSITTNMFLIEAKPLAKTADRPGMYLLILRDERWFWQWIKSTNALTDTWTHLIDGMASALGISLTLPSISSVYAKPLPHSVWTLENLRTDVWLEAALWNVGMTLVREYNGTYKGMTPAASSAQATANRRTLRIAGADSLDQLLTDGDANVTGNALVPSQLDVTFQKVLTTGGYINSSDGSVQVPYYRNIGDRYTISVSPTQAGYPGITGYGYTLTLNDMAEALFTTVGSMTPTNTTELEDLAYQMANDYFSATLDGLTEVYPGVQPWVPEGHHDLLIKWNHMQQSTMLQNNAINYTFNNYYLHHFADSPSPIITPGFTGTDPQTGNQYVNGIFVGEGCGLRSSGECALTTANFNLICTPIVELFVDTAGLAPTSVMRYVAGNPLAITSWNVADLECGYFFLFENVGTYGGSYFPITFATDTTFIPPGIPGRDFIIPPGSSCVMSFDGTVIRPVTCPTPIAATLGITFNGQCQ